MEENARKNSGLPANGGSTKVLEGRTWRTHFAHVDVRIDATYHLAVMLAFVCARFSCRGGRRTRSRPKDGSASGTAPPCLLQLGRSYSQPPPFRGDRVGGGWEYGRLGLPATAGAAPVRRVRARHNRLRAGSRPIDQGNRPINQGNRPNDPAPRPRPPASMWSRTQLAARMARVAGGTTPL